MDVSTQAKTYIASFIRAVQAAGYEATILSLTLDGDSATIGLRRGMVRVVFRAWAESRLNANGRRQLCGYVEQVHNTRIGRERLIDWTNFETRPEFDMTANGAGKELRAIFNAKEH